MAFSPLITQLIESLRCLPGVGPKTAQRMALYLLERDPKGGQKLAKSLNEAITQVKHCQQCRTLCELECCHICANHRRNKHLLCVVESPADIIAIEHTASFSGLYFVLGGHLSPLDGIGPEDIGIPELTRRLEDSDIQEVILATNPTVEGEATAHYIANLVKTFNLQASRIAHGVPLGGELEYVDGGTIAHAFAGRRIVDEP